jgi:hypothetical protein
VELLAVSIGTGASSSHVRGVARQQQYAPRLTATMPPRTEVVILRLLQCYEAKTARGIAKDELDAWTVEAAWQCFGTNAKTLRKHWARLRKVRASRMKRAEEEAS